MTPLRLALLDLIRKKTSTVIVIISVSVCVAAGGLFLRLSIMSGTRFATLVEGPNAVIGAKAGGIELLLGSLNQEGPYPDFIPGGLYQTLKQRIQFDDGSVYDPAGVRHIVPLVIFAQFGKYRVLGTDQEFFMQPNAPDSPRLLRGEWFGPGEEIIVGSEVARMNDIRVGDTLTAQSWTSRNQKNASPIRMRVTGVFEAGNSSWNRTCFSSIAEANRVFNNLIGPSTSTAAFDQLHYLLVYTRLGGFRSIATLINRRSVAELISVPEQKAHLENLTGTGIRLGVSVSFLILLLAGLSVTGVMVSRFDGMRMQMAVLKALGFTSSEMSRWLLWEGTILGFTSCILGATTDAAVFPLLLSLLGSALPSPDVVPSHIYYSAPFWIATLFGTTLAVIIPLFQLSRQDAHSLLKGL